MSVPLTGSGGLFTRLGSIGARYLSCNAYRGTTLPADLAAIQSAYASLPTETTSLYAPAAALASGANAYLNALAKLASQTVIDMVNADSPRTDRSLATALAELIRQMGVGSQSIQAATVGLSASAASGNIGDAAWAGSTRFPSGLACEGLFAESLVATCSADSQSGAAAAFSETARIIGQIAAPSRSDPTWPAGSGVTVGARAVDASLAAPGGAGTWLYNGDFESWAVANTPDNWHVRVGTAGTQVLQSSDPFGGTYALSFAGDGSTLTAIDQIFGVDNQRGLAPATQYLVGVRLAALGSPGSGAIEIALVDGSGTITLDEQGAANSVTVAAATLTSTYAFTSAAFRAPRVLPTQLRLRVRLSTALPSSTQVLVDRLAFARPLALYVGGPTLALFSGATPLVDGDAWTITTTSTRGTVDFGSLFDRWFDMKGLGLALPSSGSPTIANSLIA